MSKGSSLMPRFSNLNLLSLGFIVKVEVSYFNLMSSVPIYKVQVNNLMSLMVINDKVKVRIGLGPLKVNFTIEVKAIIYGDLQGTNKGDINNINNHCVYLVPPWSGNSLKILLVLKHRIGEVFEKISTTILES